MYTCAGLLYCCLMPKVQVPPRVCHSYIRTYVHMCWTSVRVCHSYIHMYTCAGLVYCCLMPEVQVHTCVHTHMCGIMFLYVRMYALHCMYLNSANSMAFVYVHTYIRTYIHLLTLSLFSCTAHNLSSWYICTYVPLTKH